MARWAAKVDQLVQEAPGSDEGFSPESIERDYEVSFSRYSNWAIVCEEVLDTQFSKAYFARARAELLSRGFVETEIEEMRKFAWLTAGWLNFVCLVWDWCGMDEQDIYRAIERQFSDGYISAEERDSRIAYAKRYESSPRA